MALLIGDFNAKLGRSQDESENFLGEYGYGEKTKKWVGLTPQFPTRRLSSSTSSLFNEKNLNKNGHELTQISIKRMK